MIRVSNIPNGYDNRDSTSTEVLEESLIWQQPATVRSRTYISLSFVSLLWTTHANEEG